MKEKDADNIRKVFVNHSFSCFENLICVDPQQIQDKTRSVNPIDQRPPTSPPPHLLLPKELDKSSRRFPGLNRVSNSAAERTRQQTRFCEINVMAIACVFCRDLHLTVAFPGLLENIL